MDDDKGRATVAELVADIPERLFPVGRLDYNTTGLLIMTNDGELTYTLTHPKHEVYQDLCGCSSRRFIRQSCGKTAARV